MHGWESHAREVSGRDQVTNDDLHRLTDEWELVGRTQRELAKGESDILLRSALIATSNAWFMASYDLKKYLPQGDDHVRTV